MRWHRSGKERSPNSGCVRILKLSTIQLFFCQFRANDEPWIDTSFEVGAPVLTGIKRNTVTDYLPGLHSNNAMMQARSLLFTLNPFDNIVLETCEFFYLFFFARVAAWINVVGMPKWYEIEAERSINQAICIQKGYRMRSVCDWVHFIYWTCCRRRTRSTRVTPILGLSLAPNVHRSVRAPMYGMFFPLRSLRLVFRLAGKLQITNSE